MAYEVKDIWHLEQTLHKALQTERTFLLLPDPLFIDQRGFKALEIALEERKNIEVLDLLGTASNLSSKIINCEFPQKEFCNTVKELLHNTKLQKKIYFPEDTVTK